MVETPGKGTPKDGGHAGPATLWDRLIEDWKRRPKYWLTLVAILGVVALAALLALRFFSSKTAEAENQRADDLQKALSETEAPERAARLADLRDKVAGTAQEPWILYLYATARKDAAEKAEGPAEKLTHYQEALSAANKITSKFAGTPWAVMPWRPVLPAGNPTPSPALAARLAEYCQKQIEWLGAHQVDVAETPDVGASGKIVLQSPDGKEHTLELRFFSKDAPYAVDAFFDLARQAVFDGSLVFGLERDDPNTDDVHAVHFGSAMSKLAPDQAELWGGEKDYVGFTLPNDDSRVKAKKGRVAFERRRENNLAVGGNPVDLVLYLADPKSPKERTVFAEVVGEPEVLSLLGQQAGIKEGEGDQKKDKQLTTISPARVFLPEKPWKVLKATVDGQPANPPARPLKRQFKMPEAPAKPAPPKEEPKPDQPKEGAAAPADPNK